MKKVFDLNKIDDFKKSFIAQVVFSTVFMVQLAFIEITRKSIVEFSTIAQIFLFVFLIKFYFNARVKRNYSFWGITLIFMLVIFKNIFEFTFIDYNLVALYLNFLALFFLGINTYVMSSPIFFPRVQWWEYDFRYRGDLKGEFTIGNDVFPVRISDIRRMAGCMEAFEDLNLDDKIKLIVKCHEYDIKIDVIIKTMNQMVIGRPKRYGFFLDMNVESIKQYNKLKRFWGINSKVRMRKKFKDE